MINDTELQVFKMLKYLKGNQILEHHKDIFYTVYTFIVDDPKYRKRDSGTVIIDFNKKEVIWLASNESHHNGSSYNHANGILDWDKFMMAAYDKLLPQAHTKAEQELLAEERKAFELTRNKQISKKLTESLDKII
jgi:hypothetical protein